VSSDGTENATRTALLAAAVSEFAEHGLAGARVDHIAAVAGVNKERIYGYFGSKRGLYDAVLQSELSELAAAVPLILTPEHDLAEYAGRVFDYHLARPHLLRLLHWEGLLGNGHFATEDSLRARLYQRKTEEVRRAQQSGLVNSNLDPGVVSYAIVALAAWWFAAPQVATLLVGSTEPSHLRASLVELVAQLHGPKAAAG
jgi:AcrR family transcriptional regulator